LRKSTELEREKSGFAKVTFGGEGGTRTLTHCCTRS
jgi:hypothetical protein